MDAVTSIAVALNSAANALGTLLDPIGLVPGWLSATVVAVLTGAVMIVLFKYTSNQRAIKRVRQSIRANLLAVKLFKDNVWVGLKSQGRVLAGALRLLLLAVVPLLCLVIPTLLALAQLAQWYQAAPLPVGAEAIITMKLNGEPGTPMPAVELAPTEAVEDLCGPVRIASQREVCWSIRARKPGYFHLQFRVAGQDVEKELAIGSGIMRVSPVRPERNWLKVIENPREPPFAKDSLVQSIEIDYPPRSSWSSGTDYWLYYWLSVSLLAGFCLRGVFRVNI